MASSISLLEASAFSPEVRFSPARGLSLGSIDAMSFINCSADRACVFILGAAIARAAIGSKLGPPRPPRETPPIDVTGLGVGRSPPPGSSPATALAGASSDRAFDSSGITPELDFLSHEPNVSKHSRFSSGMCSQVS